MSKTGSHFLYWVVYFPLVLNILIYGVQLINRTITWFYPSLESSDSSVQLIFLSGNHTFNGFLQEKIFGVLFAAVIGLGVWLYGYYTLEEIEN